MRRFRLSRVAGRWTGSCLLAAAALAGHATIGQTAEPNPLALPAKAVENRGALVICGGGRMPDEVYDKFVQLAGGPRARLVVVPTAYPFSSPDAAQRRYSGWKALKVAAVDFLDAASTRAAADPALTRLLERATGVWLAGGRQGRLADIYRGTPVETGIRAVLERGGVIGGTSAGAAIMSQVMIRYGTPTKATTDTGFGLLERAVVDMHFSQRRRQPRLMGVLEQHPDHVGLGIDEGTALVVQGNKLQVVGRARVTVCAAKTDGRPEFVRQLQSGETVNLIAQRSAHSGLLSELALHPIPTTSRGGSTGK